jgi:hypothetical protein
MLTPTSSTVQSLQIRRDNLIQSLARVTDFPSAPMIAIRVWLLAEELEEAAAVEGDEGERWRDETFD